MRGPRTLITTLLIVAATALRPGSVIAQADTETDLTGKWAFTVNTDAGTGSPTVTLTQKGDSLSGLYSSQIFGEVQLKGSVAGREFSFAFTASVEGRSFTVTYSGTIEAADALKGTVELSGLGNGTFTAKRQ